jgi:glycosyltransferase involved in cell wall biosynthesis
MSDTPLRILMLIPHLGVGGAQGAFLRLARYLAERAQVTVAVMQGDVSEVTDLPVFRLDEGGGSKVRRWWRMLRRLRSLKRQHDVTISFLSGMNLLNALTGQQARTIISERGSKRHDIGMSKRQRLIWTRLLDPLTYWRSGQVVAASEGLAHEIVTANPWAAGKVISIEGTVKAAALVDAGDFPVEPEIEEMIEFETIVTFGRLHVQKGYEFLIRAFACALSSRPMARLLLIGEGPERERLQELAVELGLRVGTNACEADVIFIGVKSDPVRYARIGRFFAFPSLYEGLPNALIEAIAAGVPVLASDCPWGPRSILSGCSLGYNKELSLPTRLAHGLLMPLPDDPNALTIWADELEQALERSEPRVSKQNRLEAIERYDISQTGPRWLHLAMETSERSNHAGRASQP